MTHDFARTLETAAQAERWAKMLRRIAKEVRSHADKEGCELLAEKYADYAASQRKMAEDAPAQPDPEQVPLL